MNNPLDACLVSFFVEVILKSLVIFGMAFALARCLRRASAFVRQSLWKAVICALLVLPIFCMVLPAWRVPLPIAPITAPLPPPVSPEMPWTPPTEAAVTTVPTMRDDAMPVITPAVPITAEPSQSQAVSAPVLADILPPRAEISSSHLILLLVVGTYLCGVGIVLLRMLAAFVRLRMLAQFSKPCTLPQIHYAAEHAARRVGLLCPVSVRIAAPSSRERIPMTWGWRRPCVLLPSSAQNWDAAHLDAVLLHEFAHIARSDWLIQQFAALTCALYWFHPLVWKAARLLKLESERVCDETVVAAGIAPTDYASVLLAAARAHKQNAFRYEGTISMANTAQLSVRIQSLLDHSVSRRKPSRTSVCVCGVMGLAGLLTLSSLHPADAAEPPAPFVGTTVPEEPIAVLTPAEPATAATPVAEATPAEPPSHAFAQETDAKAAALLKQTALIWMQGKIYESDVRLSNIKVNPQLSNADFELASEAKAQSNRNIHKGQSKNTVPVIRMQLSPDEEIPFGIQISAQKPAPSTTIHTTPNGTIAWGEVQDGLQTGLRNLTVKSSYSRSDYVGVMLVMRNVGTTPRRLKIVMPSSISLYSHDVDHFAVGIEGELRWYGRGNGITRSEIVVLKPNAIVSLRANIEHIPFDRWSMDAPRLGEYIALWKAPVEYRDADKPNSPRRKMPLPGSLKVKIAAETSVGILSDGTQVRYGEEVHGVQLGVSLPALTRTSKFEQNDMTFQHAGEWVGDSFAIASGQTFQTRVYLRNTTDKPVTVATYVSPTAKSQEPEQNGKKLITLQPSESRYLYTAEIEFREGEREFRLTNTDDARNLNMIASKDKNEYKWSIVQSIQFDERGESASISSGQLKLLKTKTLPPYSKILEPM